MFKKIIRPILSFALFLLITLVLFELLSAFLFRKSIIHHDLPTYSLKNIRSKFWVENNLFFGVWHIPNAHYHHLFPCFEADYQANSYGMRDPERDIKTDKHRVVVLGDSYVEGFGINIGERVSDLLEKWQQVEYLNFGTSGSFGPTQYYFLYKNFAKNFSHQTVLIGIYPKNDFTDDDIEIWRDSGYYRPFWVGTYPNYQLVYSSEKPRGESMGNIALVKGALREFTHIYHLFNYLYDAYKFTLKRVTKRSNGLHYAGYYDFTQEQWDRMRYSLEKILEEAQGKGVTIFLIPYLTDLQRYGEKGEAPLSKKMAEFAKERGIQLIDLLPFMHQHNRSWEKYFFTCEGHWNAYGNQVAAEHIDSQLKTQQISTSVVR
jgi:lysophospholipase L1-like esterase